MNVFITGANGFIGLNIVSALREANHRVCAYVRGASKIDYLEKFGVEIHRGELDDRERLRKAMRGADAVIHTAGDTSCYWRDFTRLYKVNVEGTRHIVEAALACGVERLVYTSTTSTIGAENSRGGAADENNPLTGFRARSPYAVTKLEAEKAVLSARERGLAPVVLNPAEVIGPFDHNLQWGRMVLAVYYDQVPFIPPGGASFCSAREVGRAHVKALTFGKAGQRYILAGENCSYSVFIDAISEVIRKKYQTPSSGYWWQYFKASLQEKMYFLLRRKSMVEPYRMRVFGGSYFFDSQKAQCHLDYRAAGLKDMLKDCFEWYQRNGFVPE